MPVRHLERLKDPVPLVDRAKQIAILADAFGRAQKQVAVGAQRVVEHRQDLALQIGAEIDQQIAAGHHVHAREGRIADDVMRRKDAHFAHLLGHDISGAVALEKARQPLCRDIREKLFGIPPKPRHGQGRLVYIGREDLDLVGQPFALHVFAQQYGKRIDLFAGGAGRHPQTQLALVAPVLEQGRNHRLFKCFERFGIAEEIGHADQKIAEHGRHFSLVAPQEGAITVEIGGLPDLHPAGDAAKERLALVACKIMPGMFQQNVRDDLLHFGGVGLALFVDVQNHRLERAAAIADLGKLGGHILGGQGEIHEPRGNGALRHLGIERWLAIGDLRHGHAAMLLDDLHAQRAVAIAAGQHDRSGVFLLVLSQRAEEDVDRLALARVGGHVLQLQPGALHRDDLLLRHDIDSVRLDLLTVGRDLDGHVGLMGEDRVKLTLPVGIEMGHDDKGHAAVTRHRTEQL